MSATDGLFRARVWTAPRLDRAGQAVQERMAPRVASMLSAAARQIEPARSRRRRWPALAVGITVLAAGGGAAIFVLNRRGLESHLGSQEQSTPEGSEKAADTASADVNGQVRTP